MSQPIISIPKTPPSLQEISEMAIEWLSDPPANILTVQTAKWREEHWETARWVTWAHGIGPLLYQRLHGSPTFDVLPASLQTYLANQHKLNGQRVAAMMEELITLLKAADHAGIAVVPLKGGVLVSHYYDDPALRPMADLDLLVRPGDEERLDQILLELGYQAVERLRRHGKYVLACLPNQLVYSGEHPDNPCFQLLTEDAVFVSIQDGVRLWSSSQRIHLCPDASRYFPELAHIPPQVQHNGKLKITIDLASLGEDRLCLCAKDPVVCVLQRHDQETSDLEPISRQVLIEALCKDLESGFDLNRRVHEMAQVLAQGEKYRLNIGRDLRSTVALLKSLTGQNPLPCVK